MDWATASTIWGSGHSVHRVLLSYLSRVPNPVPALDDHAAGVPEMSDRGAWEKDDGDLWSDFDQPLSGSRLKTRSSALSLPIGSYILDC